MMLTSMAEVLPLLQHQHNGRIRLIRRFCPSLISQRQHGRPGHTWLLGIRMLAYSWHRRAQRDLLAKARERDADGPSHSNR